MVGQVDALTAQQQEICAVTDKFYRALNQLFCGNVTPICELWSHTEDVSYLGPQGKILTGWNAVRSAWEEQAARKLGGKIEPKDLHIVVEGNIGICQNFEVGSNVINGQQVSVEIRALNLFRKEKGVWKMISHQTDLIPYLNVSST